MTQKVVTNDEEVTGSKIFFYIFGTFERYVTNLRGTFAENVKKVQNQSTLLYSIPTGLQDNLFPLLSPPYTLTIHIFDGVCYT
jgi:hypothetical protein